MPASTTSALTENDRENFGSVNADNLLNETPAVSKGNIGGKMRLMDALNQ